MKKIVHIFHTHKQTNQTHATPASSYFFPFRFFKIVNLKIILDFQILQFKTNFILKEILLSKK